MASKEKGSTGIWGKLNKKNPAAQVRLRGKEIFTV
jgi:hypothetical protein